ncbi:MAG: hypothetical protein ACRDTS_07775 [Mycobacterium sp.]
MGNGYRIDLGEMKSLTTTLEQAKESMNSADSALGDAAPQDLGSAGLDGAGKGFTDKWGYGIGKIADLAGKMTGGLQDTLKTYQQTEDNISKLFPDGGGASGSSGTSGGPDSSGSAIAHRLAGGA